MEVQPYALFLIVQNLRRILPVESFKQLVMMVICPLLLKDTRTVERFTKNHQEINKVHLPIYQMIACVAHHEKVRYQTRLYITLRFHSPTALDIWKEMNRLKEDEKENKLGEYSYLVTPMSRIADEE